VQADSMTQEEKKQRTHALSKQLEEAEGTVKTRAFMYVCMYVCMYGAEGIAKTRACMYVCKYACMYVRSYVYMRRSYQLYH
jgi:hypothetical protein